MLDGRPLPEHSYSDLTAFLKQQVGEGLTLDYKRELSDGSRDRGELCKDISALANSQGGLSSMAWTNGGRTERQYYLLPVQPAGSPTSRYRSGLPK